MKKKLLALLLSAVMIVTFMPTMAFADGEPTTSGQIVLTDTVDAVKTGFYSWDSGANILTLHGGTIQGVGQTDGFAFGFNIQCDATIVVEDDTTICAGDSSNDSSYGIVATGDLDITGEEGKILTVTGGECANDVDYHSAGIYLTNNDKHLTISDINVVAKADTEIGARAEGISAYYVDVEDDADVVAEGYAEFVAFGISADVATFDGATVSAKAGDFSMQSIGITAYIVEAIDSEVTATSGFAEGSYGIESGQFYAENSTVEAIVNSEYYDDEEDDYYSEEAIGISTEYTYIQESNVTTNVGMAEILSAGFACNGYGEYSYAPCIYEFNAESSNITVDVAGTVDEDESTTGGILALDVDINDDSTVSVTTGNSTGEIVGIGIPFMSEFDSPPDDNWQINFADSEVIVNLGASEFMTTGIFGEEDVRISNCDLNIETADLTNTIEETPGFILKANVGIANYEGCVRITTNESNLVSVNVGKAVANENGMSSAIGHPVALMLGGTGELYTKVTIKGNGVVDLSAGDADEISFGIMARTVTIGDENHPNADVNLTVEAGKAMEASVGILGTENVNIYNETVKAKAVSKGVMYGVGIVAFEQLKVKNADERMTPIFDNGEDLDGNPISCDAETGIVEPTAEFRMMGPETMIVTAICQEKEKEYVAVRFDDDMFTAKVSADAETLAKGNVTIKGFTHEDGPLFSNNEIMTVSVEPKDGFKVKKISVVDEEGNLVNTFGAEDSVLFFMPEGNVKVLVEYVGVYTITVQNNADKGDVALTGVTLDGNVAKNIEAGTQVTVTVTGKAGYEKSVSYAVKKSSDNEELTLTNNTFTMPAESVYIVVKYEDAKYSVVTKEDAVGRINVSKASNLSEGEEVTLSYKDFTQFKKFAVMTKDGNEFASCTFNFETGKYVTEGFTKDGNNYEFIMPASDVYVYAVLKNEEPTPGPTPGPTPDPQPTPSETYTVSFSMNGVGGTAPASQSVDAGSKAVEPKSPTAEGYTFVGWFTDKDGYYQYNFNTPVNGNLTLYAKWTTGKVVAAKDFSIGVATTIDGEIGKVTIKANGENLDEDKDYTLNVNETTGVITVKGLGKYANLNKVVEYKNVPKRGSLDFVKSTAKGKVKVVWNQLANVDGYQAKVARDTSFKTGVRTTSTKNSVAYSRTFKSLKSGSKYFAKVRAFTKIAEDNQPVIKIYGTWSKVGKVAAVK